MREIEANENYHLTVNLENQQVETPNDQTYKFDIGDFEKYCMLNGLDEIGWTLQFESLIGQYETKS
jgi:3-isopropylmalate/(R)-2-methylmalate dehydratase small subunit